jgi:hypothetical protein
MVLEQAPLPYLTWLIYGTGSEAGAVVRFLATAAALAVVSIVVGYLVAMVRHGPLKAGDLTYRVVVTGLSELTKVSPRRVWALARLAVKESLRRRVVVALVVYLLILLFAGWFMKTGYREPGRLFFSFVLTATTYLVLFIALLVSAFSLPQDFKSKTIYTVVTKPVRAGDIVLGRILGFVLVGTMLLGIMAVCSYAFVTRALYHTHQVELSSLENVVDAEGSVVGKRGRTSLDQYHRHDVTLDAEGAGVAEFTNGHQHDITASQTAGGAEYLVSGPKEMFRARVPQYVKNDPDNRKFWFLDRKGVKVAKGINVGSEWTYRSFIEGGSQGAAIWLFDGIDSSKLRTHEDGSQYLPLELAVRVFRTYQGEIERGIQGSIQLRNPETDLKSDLTLFTAKDESVNDFEFPRKLYDTGQNSIDLLDDLVSSDGQLEVTVRCLEPAQYFGFAQPDCYIPLADASPLWNFVKAQVSIWVQMVLVIAIAVTCSTVVNGPVAMMFTVAFITLGLFREFFVNVATGQQVGGGPVESLVRLVTQRNLLTEIEDNFGTRLMHAVDGVLQNAMLSLAYVLPDFRSFDTATYVADGFNIPANKLCQDLTVGLAYVAGLFVCGYFLLRTREVAK